MDYNDAIARAGGSINKLAALVGVTRQAVQYWRKNGVPRERADWLKTNTRKKKAK